MNEKQKKHKALFNSGKFGKHYVLSLSDITLAYFYTIKQCLKNSELHLLICSLINIDRSLSLLQRQIRYCHYITTGILIVVAQRSPKSVLLQDQLLISVDYTAKFISCQFSMIAMCTILCTGSCFGIMGTFMPGGVCMPSFICI